MVLPRVVSKALGEAPEGLKELRQFLSCELGTVGLELGSRYTWELARKDMLAASPMYDKGQSTPYVAVFIGNTPYTGINALANPPGSDGTVRWAGCALSSRMVQLDLRTTAKLMENGVATR